MMILDIFAFKNPAVLNLCDDILSGCIFLIAYPLDHEEPVTSNRFVSFFLLLSILFYLAARSGLMPDALYPIILGICAICYLQYCIKCKYKDVTRLFRPDTVWCVAEENARDSYACIFLFIAFFSFLGRLQGLGTIYSIIVTLFAVSLYILLHYCAYSGRMMFLPGKKQRKIHEIISAGSRSFPLDDVQDAQLISIFERVQKYMEKNKPYLNERFCLDDMAKSMCINKSYISRAVNAMSGKNFRQYVNYQRVLYSIEEMKRNPDQKVIELAFMSGFHSVVTYNICFKMFMNATPSDYLTRFRLARKR